MKSLLILPCNSGAKQGNYFTGTLWRRWSRRLEEQGLRNRVDIAAIDCIVYFYVKDGLGSIVHETEMERVKGYDSYPANRFPKSSTQNQKIYRFSEDVALGLKRWEGEYDYLLIFCNQLAYRSALRIAFNSLNLWDKGCLVDFPVIAPGVHNSAFKIAIQCLRDQTKGIVDVPFREMYRFKTEKENAENAKRWERISESYKEIK
jgi:hypothetical protein